MRAQVKNPSSEFGEDTIKQFHLTLAQYIPDSGPGRYFTGPRKILLDKSWSFTPFVEGKDKLPAMEQLGNDYGRYMQYDVASPDDAPKVVKMATDIMTRICHIHPFFDGNGRLSRLLADSIFLRAGMLQVPYWTKPELNPSERKKFLHELVVSSVNGHPNELNRFLAQEQIRAHGDVAEALEDDPRTQGLISAGVEAQRQKKYIKALKRFVDNLEGTS